MSIAMRVTRARMNRAMAIRVVGTIGPGSRQWIESGRPAVTRARVPPKDCHSGEADARVLASVTEAWDDAMIQSGNCWHKTEAAPGLPRAGGSTRERHHEHGAVSLMIVGHHDVRQRL